MTMRETPGLGLNAFWDLGANGWNTGMDTNLRLLSAVVGARVQSRTGALPASPAVGSIYIVPSADPTNGDSLAVWDGPEGARAWVYITPQTGWHFYVSDELINVQWTGAAWVQFAAGGSGGGGGSSVFGSQLLIQLEQDSGQVVNGTATLDFGEVVSDDDELFEASDNTIRIPAAQVGRTAIFVAHTKHTADGAGVIDTTLERSIDDGSTWEAIASSAEAEDYFGTTTLTALVTFIGGEWYRVRHTTASSKTTTGDAQTSLSLTTVGAGQIGRIVRSSSTRIVPNPVFATGDFTDWTTYIGTGTLKVYIPPDKESDHTLHPEGYAYVGMDGESGGPWHVETTVDLPENPTAVTVYWDQHTRLVDDQMRAEIEFLDASDLVIGTWTGGPRLNTAAQTWETFADTAGDIPTGTTKAVVRLATIVVAGSQQINVTNLRVQATTLGVSGMLPGSVYAYLPDLAGNANKVLRTNATGDDVEWGSSPIRFRVDALDESEVSDIQFLGTAFSATKVGDTIQMEFTGGLSLHGASGEVSGGVTKLTITGSGAAISSPVAGEIEIAIPGTGESVPAATAIEEIDGFDAVRSDLSADQNGQPLVWNQATNSFVPLPAGFSPIAYGGGTDLLWSGDLAGERTITLTDDDDSLYLYDEIHLIMRNANDHADIALSADGGSTWATVFYAYSAGGSTTEGTGSKDAFLLGGHSSDVDLQIAFGIVRFMSEAGVPSTYQQFGSTPNSSTERHEWGFSGSAERHNALIVQRDSAGTFTGGQLYIIGVKKTRQPVDISARIENGGVLSADQELMFHETMGVRFDSGSDIGRIRVSPAAAAPFTVSFTDRAGTEVFTGLVAAGETEGTITVTGPVVVSDTLIAVAPGSPDANVTDVFLSMRGEVAR